MMSVLASTMFCSSVNTSSLRVKVRIQRLAGAREKAGKRRACVLELTLYGTE
jgi:hypothetical protein